jgi:hypothetical protein
MIIFILANCGFEILTHMYLYTICVCSLLIGTLLHNFDLREWNRSFLWDFVYLQQVLFNNEKKISHFWHPESADNVLLSPSDILFLVFSLQETIDDHRSI